MQNFIPIDFHQTRDFSRKMNATFEFIRQNIKPLGKSILFIAGPPILIASALVGTLMGDIMNFSMLGAGDPDAILNQFTSFNFWLQLFAMMLFLLVAGVSTIATINSYIILYDEKRSNQIEVSEVWERVRGVFWMYVGTIILFVILTVAVYIVFAIPMFILASISPWLIFFGVIFLICGVLYFFVGCSLMFFIRAYEKKGFFESLFRSFFLIRDKWWSTFGLIMILMFIMGTISYFFLIPYYVILFMNAMHQVDGSAVMDDGSGLQIWTVVFFTLYYLAQMILYTLPNVGIAFQYFNLVERKEARGLMNELDSFGQSPATSSPTSDEQY